MVLSGKGLRGQLGDSIRIKPFREGNLSGDSYDITLAREFLRLKSDEMGVIDPTGLELVGERTMARDFVLQPGDFVLARSEEWVELGPSVMAMISGRSSLARLGLHVESAAIIHPGSAGYIVMEIQNKNSVPFRLVQGMKAAQLVFFETSDAVEKYVERKDSEFRTQRSIEFPRSIGFSD